MSKRAAEQAEQDGIAPVSGPGSGEIVSLPPEQLVPAEDNPRRELGDLTELAASIRTAGILQPLVVMPREDGRYLVVVGHRRLAAALVVGLTEVPAIVRGFTEAERLEAMAIENLAREGPLPWRRRERTGRSSIGVATASGASPGGWGGPRRTSPGGWRSWSSRPRRRRRLIPAVSASRTRWS